MIKYCDFPAKLRNNKIIVISTFIAVNDTSRYIDAKFRQ